MDFNTKVTAMMFAVLMSVVEKNGLATRDELIAAFKSFSDDERNGFTDSDKERLDKAIPFLWPIHAVK
jgi:hypothetical protein